MPNSYKYNINILQNSLNSIDIFQICLYIGLSIYRTPLGGSICPGSKNSLKDLTLIESSFSALQKIKLTCFIVFKTWFSIRMLVNIILSSQHLSEPDEIGLSGSG